MVTTFEKNISIDASKESIWKVISNLGQIQKFHPGVSKSYYTSDNKVGLGAARICEFHGAGKIKETVKQWHEGSGFMLKIDPIEKAPPVKNFNGLFRLIRIGDDMTKVSLTVTYGMKLGAIGVLLNKLVIQSKMEKGMEGLLKGLKVYIETGVEIENEKSLTSMLQPA